MYYCAIDILAIAILLIENFDIFTKRGADFSNTKWSAFRNFLISVLAFYATDVLWSVFEMRKLALAMFIDTSLYFVPMQPGDVPVTYADTSALERDFGYKPSTSLRTGLRNFAEWYKDYYKV